jgi:hypothetical protein
MASEHLGAYACYVTKKRWRYPDRPIPERLKRIYALNPQPERRVHYG